LEAWGLDLGPVMIPESGIVLQDLRSYSTQSAVGRVGDKLLRCTGEAGPEALPPWSGPRNA